MASTGQNISNTERRKLVMLRIRQKMAQLDSSKKEVDEEVEELKMKLLKVIQDFSKYDDNLQKTTKMLAASLVASLSSVTFGLRSNLANIPGGASVPLFFSFGSVVCSLYYFKELLSSIKRQPKQQYFHDLYSSLLIPKTFDYRRDFVLGVNYMNKRLLSLSLPQELFSSLTRDDRKTIQRARMGDYLV